LCSNGDDYVNRDDGSDDELSDHEINKLLIVTQFVSSSDAGAVASNVASAASATSNAATAPVQLSQSSRCPKHEGHDRTGDWSTRVKMSQDLAQVINDGLNYYEDDLWTAPPDWVCLHFFFFLRVTLILFTITILITYSFVL
jgi:la-related protein 1